MMVDASARSKYVPELKLAFMLVENEIARSNYAHSDGIASARSSPLDSRDCHLRYVEIAFGRWVVPAKSAELYARLIARASVVK